MIVVFGSMNADLLFNVDALPRAGETVLCPGHRAVAGGKGLNQAVAAARANTDPAASVQMVGRVGPDGFAPLALQALKDAGVGTEAITESALPTGCAAVIVDRAGENQITVASGANTDLPPEALPEEWLGPETVLVLQMEVPLESNWAVARRAKARGARVVLNLAPAKPAPTALLPSFDLLVFNEIEAGMLAGAQGLDAASGEEAGRAIAARFGVTTVVSLGSAGAAAFAPMRPGAAARLQSSLWTRWARAMPSSRASPSGSRQGRRCRRCSTGRASQAASPASSRAPLRRCRRQQRLRRGLASSRRRSLWRYDEGTSAARSGNRVCRPSSEASQTPRSVMSAVTSRAGVTSKA